jgi:hypothetical protein
LSDEGNRDGISAYSVFNRGFERLLGSVDVDSLLAQHVGGGLGGVGGGGIAIGNPNIDREGRPHRIQERAAARIPIQQEENDTEIGIDDEDDDNENDDNENNNNRSRKSGKKARRRNLEQRRDIRRQREAAIQMGLNGDEGPEEMMAMQRLIEQQIAAENENNDGEVGRLETM